MNTIPINVWSSPRNISTAFMYSWAQRKDCTVIDEPLYAHYLRVTDIEHPGRKEILESQNQYADQVINEIILKPYSTPLSLFKQMTHHLVDINWQFLLSCKNIILIRNPREIIASYSKIIPDPTLQDIGVKKQLELFKYLSNHQELAAIIDTNELLKNPAKILNQLCEILNIPFDKNMLSWKPQKRKEDGIWAKYWYHNVHQSTGFQPYKKKNITLTTELEKLASSCMSSYHTLFKYSLKA